MLRKVKNSRGKKSKNNKKLCGGSLYENNAGLFGGEQATGPWASIKVEPTTTNYINNNLKSAEPPPQAPTQYQGTNRLGNNTQEMLGVSDYVNNQGINIGPFKMKAVGGGHKKRNEPSKKKKKQNKNKKNKTTLKKRMFRIIG